MAEVLRYRVGQGDERTLGISGDEIRVGRHPSCHVVVDVDGVEAVHCRLLRGGGGWLVEDCSTRNGTFVVFAGTVRPVLMLADGPERPRTRGPVGPDQEVLIGHGNQPHFLGAIAAKVESATPWAEPDEPKRKDDQRPPPVQPEVEQLRRELARVRQERDDLAAALEQVRAGELARIRWERDDLAATLKQVRAELTRVKHDYDAEAASNTAHISRIAALEEERDALRKAKAAALGVAQAARASRDEQFQIVETARREANSEQVIAQQRAIIIVEQSGRIAELEGLLQEAKQELGNRDSEIQRLRKALADSKRAPGQD